MTLFSLDALELALVTLAFAASGIVRGFGGGIGANFLTAPVLAALIGPREAVPIVMLLNMVGNLQLMPQVLPSVNWRDGWPLFFFPILTVPLGGWLLFTVDEDVMRRAIAAAALGFSLLLLSGWRYRGGQRIGLSIVTGSVSGVLVGSVSLGGPPAFLYLLAGSGDAATNRAQFVMFGTTAGLAALVMFAAVGAYRLDAVLFACFLLVPAAVGIWLGSILFRRASEDVFRRICLWGLVAVSLCVLVI